MTAGYYSDHYYDGNDHEIWVDKYGLDTSLLNSGGKIGSITPQNIGAFKINDIIIEENTSSFVDGSEEETDNFLVIRTNYKCLISFKGRTYRVDTFQNNYYFYASEDYDFRFTDGEKVEITYELL